MAKVKATKLKPWQKEISKEEFLKEIQAGNVRAVGQNTDLGKTYRIDITDPEYKKFIVAKKKVRQAKLEAIRKRYSDRGYRKGVKEGVRAFRNSEAMKKIEQSSFNKGVKAAKPKQNIADKIAKKKAKLQIQQKQLAAMEAKLK